MNLIEDCWIPVLREDGLKELIAPWQLTDKFETNPIVALAAPRPDFQGGLMQFLIGLLQTVTPPEEDGDIEWEEWLEEPPTPEILRQSFEPYIDCFNLDGDGPLFMQDLDLNDGKTVGVDSLLVDSPGDVTIDENRDHFVKRGRAQQLCYSCAATALFTMQVNAFPDGPGYYTSVRDNSPLTTLLKIDPQGSGLDKDLLWYNVWLNVLDKSTIEDNADQPREKKFIFLWLAPTRTSEEKTGRDTYADNVHPLHVYWSMPRRFKLEFGQVSKGACDICTNINTKLVTKVQKDQGGVNYEGAWQHSLSPKKFKPKANRLVPARPPIFSHSYTDWSNWVDDSDPNVSLPAMVVRDFRSRLKGTEQLRLWALGYVMKTAKVMNYYDSTFPLYLFDQEQSNQRFSERLKAHINASKEVARLTAMCVKNARYNKPKTKKDPKKDWVPFLKESYYVRTENHFFESMNSLKKELDSGEDGKETLGAWYKILVEEAKALFKECVERGDARSTDMKKIAAAYKELEKGLSGKKLRNLLDLSTEKRGRT